MDVVGRLARLEHADAAFLKANRCHGCSSCNPLQPGRKRRPIPRFPAEAGGKKQRCISTLAPKVRFQGVYTRAQNSRVPFPSRCRWAWRFVPDNRKIPYGGGTRRMGPAAPPPLANSVRAPRSPSFPPTFERKLARIDHRLRSPARAQPPSRSASERTRMGYALIELVMALGPGLWGRGVGMDVGSASRSIQDYTSDQALGSKVGLTVPPPKSFL